MHGDTGSVSLNLREVMRGEMFAASRDRRRIISEWIRARDAEGEVSNIAGPDVPTWHAHRAEDEGEAVAERELACAGLVQTHAVHAFLGAVTRTRNLRSDSWDRCRTRSKSSG
jgi:hypothetical protein